MSLKWSRHPLITAVALGAGWLAVACSNAKVQERIGNIRASSQLA